MNGLIMGDDRQQFGRQGVNYREGKMTKTIKLEL